MYIVIFCLSLLLGLAAVILLFIGFTRKKRKYENMGVFLSALVAFIVIWVIEIPSPIIYPLNNETEIYNNNLDVTISSVPFVSIYYSLDGNDPKKGQLYAEPIKINNSTTVSARSRFLFFWSDIMKSAYNFDSPDIAVNAADKAEETEEDETVYKESSANVTPENKEQTVVWNEPIFEKIFTDYFGKENISQFDLENIKTISLYGTDFVYINEPFGHIIEGTHTSKFAFYLDNTKSYIYKENKQSEAKVYSFGDFISLDDIKYFSNLQDLHIYGFESIDCSVFSKEPMKNLRYLALNNCGITNDQVRSVCTQTQLLNIALEYGEFNNITDITNLTNLQYLSLRHNNNIDNIMCLENNINLKRLEIGYTNITDVSPLSKLSNLKYLGVKNCPVQDFSPVNFIPEISK